MCSMPSLPSKTLFSTSVTIAISSNREPPKARSRDLATVISYLKKTHWHPMKGKFDFWGHQALFESLDTNYRGSKRLWGSPHQVWLLVFDFTFSCILKKFNWDFARQGITDMSIVSPASFIVTADWLDPLSITSLTSPLSLCTNRSSVIASFGL